MGTSFADRRFQLWDYLVSHGGLLIRSPKSATVETTVDLVFDGVEFLSCPRLMRGLDIVDPTADDVATVDAAFGAVDAPNAIVVLLAEGRRNYIVASSMRIEEHVGDIFHSPLRP